MGTLLPYLTIIRPQNVLLTGIAVSLGFWLGHSALPASALVFLIMAAAAATGFGNVVNDLKDIATDRISHPDRPLARGAMSIRAARFYSGALGFAALLFAWMVSPVHCAATAIPLLLLLIYAQFLKGTPLAGNIVVSMLVAYALLFGGLRAPLFSHLIVPALLAFLLNLSREIIKDLEDAPGDRAAGIITTAALSTSGINILIYCISATYLLLLFFPYFLKHFGNTYTIICGAIVIPLQICWLAVFAGRKRRLSLISLLIKLEMAAGLLALAIDRIFRF
jgi:geranylgeranylglycerol-phosphate geranylgeranyltransferase